MFLIRQSRSDDKEQIFEVARHLDSVNLPARPDLIASIIDRSVQSFAAAIPAVEREYLFILEDTDRQRIVGTSMIYAQHGTKRSPHIFFQVLKDEHYSQTLDRYFVHQALRLGYDYHGPTEIGGLILEPEYRQHPAQLGKTLSFVRFLFIAMHRSVFRDRVMAELLPPLEPDGTSVLWEHLGKRFTGLEYFEADLLSRENKEFIHTLFPHNLIYTALFPQNVRDMIGQVGPDTRGVEKMLRSVGFRYARHIDPFDGGPHFVASTDEITVVKNAHPVTVRAIDGADASRPWAIVASAGDRSFRATGARVIPDPEKGTFGLTSDVRELLGVEAGESVWAVVP